MVWSAEGSQPAPARQGGQGEPGRGGERRGAQTASRQVYPAEELT